MPSLAKLIQHPVLEVQVDACWALSFLADGNTKQIQVDRERGREGGRKGRERERGGGGRGEREGREEVVKVGGGGGGQGGGGGTL